MRHCCRCRLGAWHAVTDLASACSLPVCKATRIHSMWQSQLCTLRFCEHPPYSHVGQTSSLSYPSPEHAAVCSAIGIWNWVSPTTSGDASVGWLGAGGCVGDEPHPGTRYCVRKAEATLVTVMGRWLQEAATTLKSGGFWGWQLGGGALIRTQSPEEGGLLGWRVRCLGRGAPRSRDSCPRTGSCSAGLATPEGIW